MNNSEKHHNYFRKLLEQIRSEISKLKTTNQELKRENNELKSKLEEVKEDQNDIFSAISESDRIAMKNRIDGLISKIDRHLKD